LILQREWVYLKRNLSGKYNVVKLANGTAAFDKYKGDRSANFQDGIYVDLGAPARVELIDSTSDAVDFYYPNGHLRGLKAEWLSYVSGTRKDVDATSYLLPVSEPPPSETE